MNDTSIVVSLDALDALSSYTYSTTALRLGITDAWPDFIRVLDRGRFYMAMQRESRINKQPTRVVYTSGTVSLIVLALPA